MIWSRLQYVRLLEMREQLIFSALRTYLHQNQKSWLETKIEYKIAFTEL